MIDFQFLSRMLSDCVRIVGLCKDCGDCEKGERAGAYLSGSLIVLFYILRPNCAPIALGFQEGLWIVYGLLDCVFSFKINKLFDCWSHVRNLPFTYIKI